MIQENSEFIVFVMIVVIVRIDDNRHMLLLFVSLRPWPGSLLCAEKFD